MFTKSGAAIGWRRLLRRSTLSAVSIVATLGWMAFTLALLIPPHPPAPAGVGSAYLAGVPLTLLGHLFLFAVLAFLLSSSAALLSPTRKVIRDLIASVTLGSAWGIITELIQISVPQRIGSLEDALTDFAGAIIGAAAASATHLLIERFRS